MSGACHPVRMRPRPRLRIVALLVLVGLALVATACGGDDDDAASDGPSTSTTTTTEADEPADGDSKLCTAAQRLADLDDESQGLVNAALGEVLAQSAAGDDAAADAALTEMLDEVQTFIDERLPELLDAYDDLAANVPEERAADVALIRDFTEELVRAVGDVETVDDLEALIAEQQGSVGEVSGALERLDQLTQDECGVVLAD